MTKESMFEELVYVNVPSRTVLTSVLQDGLLKKSAFSSNAFIYHFDDIRDAIDLILKSLRHDKLENKHFSVSDALIEGISSSMPASSIPLVFNLNQTAFNGNHLKMNEIFDSEEVRFACSQTSEVVLNSLSVSSSSSKNNIQLSSATILITLNFLGEPDDDTFASIVVPFERADVLMDKIKSLLIQFGGPILASSELKRNLETGTIFKFFVEFYRVSDGKRFLEISEQVGGGPIVSDQNVQISFEGVQLCDIDRESLFFTSKEAAGMTTEHVSNIDLKGEGNIYILYNLNITLTNTYKLLEIKFQTFNSYKYSTNTAAAPSNLQSNSSSSGEGNFEIDLWKIENDLEKRTTCMIRNIPNKYTQQMVLDLVNESHRGCFDFLYLRMDFRNRCNVGYAFINFTKPAHILTFATRVNGKRWARFNSDKICHLTFARIQGTCALIDKFRNSKVMFEAPAYRPKLFETQGPQTGQELPFPTCL